jgi:hypothetical protein
VIIRASITATDSPPRSLAIPDQSRGARDYPLDGWDLLAFGRSPDRWVNTPKPEPDERPDFGEIVCMLHLTPQLAPAHYIQRPATYQAMFNVCPNCGSASAAKICRACNAARTNVTEQRPWSASAKYCAAWTEDAHRRNLRIVPVDAWDKAATAVARLNADSEIADLANQSAKQLCLSGVWHDPETNLEIPLRAMLSYAPLGGRSHDDKLGSLTITRDASPLAWSASAYNRGRHIVAALKQDLYAAATSDPRPTHVWVLVERDEPHIIGRRRTSPEMLLAGRTGLDDLMAAYAKCLKTGLWPTFDPNLPGAQEAWSRFHLEPWMTQGDGRAATYFGVTNAPSLVQHN